MQAALIASGRPWPPKASGPGHRVPAGLGPAPVGVRPAGRGGHLVVLELDAVFVAYPVERRQHVGGKMAGFLQHGGGDVGVEIAVMAGFHGGLQAGAMIEGQQHVVDRRAIGHVGVSLKDWSSGPPSSHETALLSTPRWMEKGAGSAPNGAFSGPKQQGSRGHHAALCADKSSAFDSTRKRGSGLLKWLNSLYRPALPERNPRQGHPAAFQTALGRRQVVRQWILIPPFGGSNPPAPARF